MDYGASPGTEPIGKMRVGRRNRQEKIRNLLRTIREKHSLSPAFHAALPGYLQTLLNDLLDHHRAAGQILFEAVSADAPLGMRKRKINPAVVKLTVFHRMDLRTREQEVLLKKRILRLSREAHEQGALLTQKDLSILLGVSVRTIQRHIKSLQHKGESVPTRGRRPNCANGEEK